MHSVQAKINPDAEDDRARRKDNFVWVDALSGKKCLKGEGSDCLRVAPPAIPTQSYSRPNGVRFMSVIGPSSCRYGLVNFELLEQFELIHVSSDTPSILLLTGCYATNHPVETHTQSH